MPVLTLRPETTADESFLRRLYASARTVEMDWVPWPEQHKTAFLNQQFDAQRHHYRTHCPDAEFSLVSVNGNPAGRWYLHRGEAFFTLIDICLLPEYRGRGIGSRLLESLLAEAGAAGMSVRLHVEAFNPAQTLYARLGFELLEERGLYRLMEWRPAAETQN